MPEKLDNYKNYLQQCIKRIETRLILTVVSN